jgi:hypothetical protein
MVYARHMEEAFGISRFFMDGFLMILWLTHYL